MLQTQLTHYYIHYPTVKFHFSPTFDLGLYIFWSSPHSSIKMNQKFPPTLTIVAEMAEQHMTAVGSPFPMLS